jgi:hypothetical protein
MAGVVAQGEGSEFKPQYHKQIDNFKKKLLECVHCTGGISSDNSDYSYIAHLLHCPIGSPFQPSPHPTLSNCRKFLCSISYKYTKSIHHTPSP